MAVVVRYLILLSISIHITENSVDLLLNIPMQRSVERNKPSGAKGIYWKTAYLCSSMGPSIKLNIKEMLDYGTDSSD
jgi:large subunit ribosomal protein L1